jgi:hypothetical protein
VLAALYLLAGVAFVVAAVYLLGVAFWPGGFWWALLAAGVLLLVLGALEARGDAVPGAGGRG